MRLADKINSLNPFLFSLLFLITPLILTPFNSELFEFNKIITLYAFTILIISFWTIRMVIEKRIIYTRTLLEFPLLIFSFSQLTSTLLSIDIHTSIFGYYGRFNGGLLSTICYTLLYFALVSNINSKKHSDQIIFASLIAVALISIYGIAQHYGVDANIWKQDVKNRIFSTLGQPNWLASYLVVLIFIPMSKLIEKQKNSLSIIGHWSLVICIFTALLFTKSRSGLIAIAMADLIFLFLTLLKNHSKSVIQKLTVIHLPLAILTLYFGTPWTTSIEQRLTRQAVSTVSASSGELLISESGDIRKIVWKGAIDLWKLKPWFGTGPETFAYSYFWTRPIAHNSLSEWDFIYNKAHNQFLNYAATSGTIGLGAYLFIILATSWLLLKANNIALLAGWFSLNITNFFGFSVVATDVLFFLVPAIAICASRQTNPKPKPEINHSRLQLILSTLILIPTSFFLVSLAKYWLSDYRYAQALKQAKRPNEILEALNNISHAIKLSPMEPVYLDELASIASDLSESTISATISAQFKDLSLLASSQTINLSPYNLSFYKNRVRVLYSLSSSNPSLLQTAIETLKTAIILAPTDAKLYYNLGLLQSRNKQTSEAIATFNQAFALKSNYQDPLLALALIYEEQNQKELARAYYQKLLELNPNHPTAKQKLNLN